MAEEAKMQFKAVEVSMDAEGNQVITDVEKPTADDDNQNDDNQDDNQNDDDNQDDNQDNDDNQNDDNQDDNQDDNDSDDDNQDDNADDADSDDDNQDDNDSDDDADDDDSGADSDDDDVHTQDEEDVVDYDELPESVQGYLDFLEDTGGSMQDYLQANRDFSKMPQDEAIRAHLKATNPYLDEDDIQYEIETRFGITEDDTDNEARAKKIAKKKFYGEAVKSLTESNAKYKADLGSSAAIPQKATEAIKFQETFLAQQSATAKKTEAVRSSFVKETNKVLGKDFKGFEVKIDGEAQTYKPNDVRKTKEHNLDVNNLLNKFKDDKGNINDVKGYHKAMTFASNPDAVAQHFFELGKAAAIEEDVKDSKNINMKPRQVQQGKKGAQPKYKFVDLDSSNNKKAKIKLRNYH